MSENIYKQAVQLAIIIAVNKYKKLPKVIEVYGNSSKTIIEYNNVSESDDVKKIKIGMFGDNILKLVSTFLHNNEFNQMVENSHSHVNENYLMAVNAHVKFIIEEWNIDREEYDSLIKKYNAS